MTQEIIIRKETKTNRAVIAFVGEEKISIGIRAGGQVTIICEIPDTALSYYINSCEE